MRQSDTLIVINRNGMGSADEALQLHVLGVWLKLTLENGTLPGAIALYTEGVRVACEGSPVVDELRAFEDKGVHIILCKTCLDELGLSDKYRVGIVGGMGDVIAAQATAKKVIAL